MQRSLEVLCSDLVIPEVAEYPIVVRTVFVNRHNEVAVVRTTGGGTLPANMIDLPGGKQDAGEDDKTTAMREGAEELGIDFSSDTPVAMGRPFLWAAKDGATDKNANPIKRLIVPAVAYPDIGREPIRPRLEEDHLKVGLWMLPQQISFMDNLGRLAPQGSEVWNSGFIKATMEMTLFERRPKAA